MLKRAMWVAVAVAVTLVWSSAPVDAASIVLSPNQILFGLPGTTVGWGYKVTADLADGDLEFTSIDANLPAGNGSSISVGVFDFPFVLAGTSVQLAYDPLGGFGLVELMLSPLLSPGSSVTGTVFGTYVLHKAAGGVTPDQPFELTVTASVPGPVAVPEPATLLLVATGLIAVVWRRRSRA